MESSYVGAHCKSRSEAIVVNRPTTREVFRDSASPLSAGQDDIEREFFQRVLLPNGTFKTTNSNRLDDLNEAAFPYIEGLVDRPVKLMDVGVSSGVSTLEWYEHLAGKNVSCDIVATDLTIFASLLSSRTFNLAALIDRHKNILHLDILGRGAPPRAVGLNGVVAGAIRAFFRTAMSIDSHLPSLNCRIHESAKGRLLTSEPVVLLTKRLIKNQALQFAEEDLRAQNRPEFANAFHVVRACNVISRVYFSDAILTQIIHKLRRRLKANGLFIVCKTTDFGVNHATLFRLGPDRRFAVLARLGDGSEIEHLITADSGRPDRI